MTRVVNGYLSTQKAPADRGHAVTLGSRYKSWRLDGLKMLTSFSKIPGVQHGAKGDMAP